MQEEDLIASIKKGNHHAFELIVNQYKDMVFSISIKITENYHQAEEVAQDSFLKAYQQIHRFKGESKFSTWLYRITVNTAYNKIRQKRVVENLDDWDTNISSENLEGFERLALEDQRASINLALSQLKKLEALLISLFYLEEQTIDELAIVTDLSPSNVKVRLHRARKKLKEIMEKSFSHKLDQL